MANDVRNGLAIEAGEPISPLDAPPRIPVQTGRDCHQEVEQVIVVIDAPGHGQRSIDLAQLVMAAARRDASTETRASRTSPQLVKLGMSHALGSR
jgi:hypothetical protein